MEFARISWITVCAICALAVILLAIEGYTGYSIVVGAVGLSAAVNLIDYPRTGPPDPG
jgi:hypothetical protein